MSKSDKPLIDNTVSLKAKQLNKKSKKRKQPILEDGTPLKKKKKVKQVTIYRNENKQVLDYLNQLISKFKDGPEPMCCGAPRKMSSDALHQQAQYIAEMFKILNNTHWNMYDQEYFLISTKWLCKWKQYVNYDDVVKSMENKSDIKSLALKSAPYPGPISNDTLILEQKDYFHDFNNIDSHYNMALRDNITKGKDFIIVSRSIWDYLHTKYGGMQIMRKQINIGVNGKAMVDYKLQKVNELAVENCFY